MNRYGFAIKRGIEHGTTDRKLMTSWSLKAGGTGHRELAAPLRTWAARVADQCRTAAALRKLASTCEDLGHWEDDLSEEFEDQDP
jgi:hypothetical protein